MAKAQQKKEATVPIGDYSRLKEMYAEELKRKDEVIEKLKEENKLLIKSALKQSERNVMLSEKLKKKIK